MRSGVKRRHQSLLIPACAVTPYLRHGTQLETFSRVCRMFQLRQYRRVQFCDDWLMQIDHPATHYKSFLHQREPSLETFEVMSQQNYVHYANGITQSSAVNIFSASEIIIKVYGYETYLVTSCQVLQCSTERWLSTQNNSMRCHYC